jgi:transcriptional regulator with XRE-family HTH domain
MGDSWDDLQSRLRRSIDRLRRKRHLSRRKLTQRAHVWRGTLDPGRPLPTLNHVAKLAEALEVPPSTLFVVGGVVDEVVDAAAFELAVRRRLRELRLARSMGTKLAGQLADVEVSWIIRIESGGITAIDLRTLFNYCAGIGADLVEDLVVPAQRAVGGEHDEDGPEDGPGEAAGGALEDTVVP